MKSLGTFISPIEICHYLPQQRSRFEYEFIERATHAEYGARLRQGWRRFGHAWFRPVCPHCCACRSLRVPVDRFTPDRSQRRAWNENHGVVTLTIGEPAASPEKQHLFDAFHRFQTHTKGWPESGSDYADMFVRNPMPTEEWCYHVGGALVGVGYVDPVPDGLSAIYFYYDPAERHRSLGTFNVLTTITEARTRRLPYAYLGYFVEGCRSLEYKGRFRPNEALSPDGWQPFRS